MVAVIVLLYITTTINFFLNGPFLTVTTEVSFRDYSILALIPSWGWDYGGQHRDRCHSRHEYCRCRLHHGMYDSCGEY